MNISLYIRAFSKKTLSVHLSVFVFFLVLILSLLIHPSSFSMDSQTSNAKDIKTKEKDTQKNREKKVTFNFIDVDIPVVVKFISEVTGKNFVFDDKVKGTVTIIAPSKLSVEDAFSLFTSVLELKGFTIIQMGKVYKIVPLSQARQSGTELIKDEKAAVNDAYITRIIQLNSISSTKAMNFLQPLISRDGHISSYGPGNMLLIVDSSSNIEKIMKIIESIDKQDIEEPELIMLKYASAEEIVKMLNESISNIAKSQTQTVGVRPPLRGETVSGVSVDETRPNIFADTRLNAIIMIAGKQEKEEIKRMIKLLDVPMPEATSKINVYFLEYADATELSKVLEGMISGISQIKSTLVQTPQSVKGPFESGRIVISPDKATNSLIIVAPPADYQNIMQVIKQLDRRRKQVYVEAMIVEASIDNLKELGAQWRITAEKNNEPVFISGFGKMDASAISNVINGLSGMTLGGIGNFLNVPVTTTDSSGNTTTTTLTIPGFAALFSLNEFKGAVNVLSTPQILTSDNKEAEIVVGENVPFISKRERDITTSSTILNSIERKDVGITLRLTPQITEGDYVKMELYQEISSLKGDTENIILNVGPTTTKRSTKTSVVVKDGQTVVIGGLMEEKEEVNINKVPLLGDVPVLGWIFKNKKQEKKKTNLLIFLTPHIVKESEHLEKLSENKRSEFARAEERFKQGELLVKFKEGVSESRINEILTSEEASIIRISKSTGVYNIKLKENIDVLKAVEKFQLYKEVQFAEPNYIIKMQHHKSKIEDGNN